MDFANHRALSDHKTVVEFNKLIVFIIKSINAYIKESAPDTDHSLNVHSMLSLILKTTDNLNMDRIVHPTKSGCCCCRAIICRIDV